MEKSMFIWSLLQTVLLCRILSIAGKSEKKLNIDIEGRNAVERWIDWQKFVLENILKRFSINFMPVVITSVRKSTGSALDKFDAVLMLAKRNDNPNTTLEFIRKKLESGFHPTNWVFMCQNTMLNFKPFFIPHDEWYMYTLYSATGNILIKNHIGTVCSLKLMSPKDSSKPKGFCGELVGVLQQFINFTYKPSRHGLFGGVYKNNTPYGMLAKLYKNESDIGMLIAHTRERAKFAQYSPTVFSAFGVIMYRQHRRIFFYFEPLLSDVWISITCCILLIAVLLTINKYNYQRNVNNLYLLLSFIDYAISSCYTLLLTVTLYLLQVFHLFSILMFTSYTSTLTSILTITKEYIPFVSLEELVYQTDYTICTLRSSNDEETLRINIYTHNSKFPLFSATWRKIQSDPDKYSAKSIKAALQLVYSSKTAFLVNHLTGEYTVKGNCSYRFAKIPFLKLNVAFIYHKEFIYKKIFLALQENGVLAQTKIHNRLLPHNEACRSDVNQSLVVPIKLSLIIGLFLTLFAGIAISLLIFHRWKPTTEKHTFLSKFSAQKIFCLSFCQVGT
uniref:Ionotropic glutamate receptor C-terminal domain-containing protein n=1 Tax=Strigamia maritima TaxID=126957 RepID=T1JL03_STRMM